MYHLIHQKGREGKVGVGKKGKEGQLMIHTHKFHILSLDGTPR